MTWPQGLLDQQAVGRAAFWLAAPISLVGVLTVLPPGLGLAESAGLWLVGSLACTAMLGLGMLAGSVVVRRCAGNLVAQRAAVAAAILVAGALRGIGLDLAFTITGQDEAYSPPSRILVSSVIFALWLTLIGGLLSAWSRYQRQRQDMLDEYLTRQLQLRLLDPDRSGVLGDDTVRRLDDMTAAVQEVLSGADAASHADYGQLSASLKAVIDERMRPLLHQMWFAEEPGAVADPSTKSFLVRSLLTPVPLGWALGVYGVTVFVAGMISIGVGLGWVAAAIEFSALALIVLAERVAWPVPRALPRACTLALAGAVPVFLAWLLLHQYLAAQVSWAAAISLTITGPGVIFGSCAARAALEDGGPSVRELRELLDDQVWDAQLRALETRSSESELATVLHNTVQARLYAAAIQLETASLAGDDSKAQAALKYAREAIDSPVPSAGTRAGTLLERLEPIRQAWQGIVDVRITCPEALPMTAGAKLLADAAEECVANAVRHAHARQVSVVVSGDEADLVLIVTDDGLAPGPESAPGIGTAWMEKVSRGRFERTGLPDSGNQVTMRIKA